MNIIQRLWRAARGQSVPPTRAIARAGASSRKAAQALQLWPGWKNDRPHWSLNTLDAWIADGFERNAIIYSAIMYKVRAARTAPLRAYLGDPQQPELAPPTHPLARLVSRPNPYMSAIEFSDLLTGFYNLAGQAFVYMARKDTNAVPHAMYVLRPDRVAIIPTDESDLPGVKGYIYAPAGKSAEDAWPILPQDMMHIKMPNLGDPLMGMGAGLSPVRAMAQSGDVDNEITEFLMLFFEHGAMPPGVLSFDVPMNDDEIGAAKRRWMEIYGGYENWADIAVLDQGGKYTKIGQSFAEMGFDNLDARNETRILAPFGVPPILIGTRSGMTRASYGKAYFEARRAFWEDTMVPEMALVEADLQYYLTSADGGFVMFDRSQVPALQANIVELSRAFRDLVETGVPARIAAVTVGLKIEEYAGDSQSRLPSGQDVTVNVDSETPTGEGTQGQDQTATSDTRSALPPGPAPAALPAPRRFKAYDRAQMGTKVDQVAVSHEQAFGEAAEAQFEQDRRELLALIKQHQTDARQRKGTLRWSQLKGDILDYLKGQSEEEWRERFIPLIEAVMVDAGDEWAVALGVEWNVRNLRAEAWFQDYTLTFAKPINETTADDVQAVLAQAQAEGWTVRQMEDRLGLVFEQYMTGDLTPDEFAWFEDRMPQHRREAIARTETIRSANAGSHHLFGEWGVERHEWLHTTDGRTRDTHVEAGQKYRAGGSVGPIPLTQPFIVGGYEMMYPGDASRGAPPKEFVNCRCADLPTVEDDKALPMGQPHAPACACATCTSK